MGARQPHVERLMRAGVVVLSEPVNNDDLHLHSPPSQKSAPSRTPDLAHHPTNVRNPQDAAAAFTGGVSVRTSWTSQHFRSLIVT